MSNKIKDARRRAFQKREQIMRQAISEALGMLMQIPDGEGKISPVGEKLADALVRESAVEIPDPRPPEVKEKQIAERKEKLAKRGESEIKTTTERDT